VPPAALKKANPLFSTPTTAGVILCAFDTQKSPAEESSMLKPAAIGDLKRNFRGELMAPSDAGYDAARRVWNGMVDKRPALIARCTGANDVVACINFAREH